MRTADDLWRLLYRTAEAFSEGDYLSFLGERVPRDIEERLDRNSQPDLSLSKAINIADLMRPLSVHSFPSDELFYEVADVLSHTLYGYQGDLADDSKNHDSYELVYVASLYLHCYIRGHGKPHCGPFTFALSALANTCARLDLQTRLQVSWFLSSLLPALRTGGIGDYAPLSSALITVSLILGSVIDHLAVLAFDAMRHEGIEQAWREEEGEMRAPCHDAISDLKRSISAAFGVRGHLRRSADRFLPAIREEDKEIPLVRRSKVAFGPGEACSRHSGRGCWKPILDALRRITNDSPAFAYSSIAGCIRFAIWPARERMSRSNTCEERNHNPAAT
jgi:hypothetical protein